MVVSLCLSLSAAWTDRACLAERTQATYTAADLPGLEEKCHGETEERCRRQRTGKRALLAPSTGVDTGQRIRVRR